MSIPVGSWRTIRQLSTIVRFVCFFVFQMFLFSDSRYAENRKSKRPLDSHYLKGYALCRRPLLAPHVGSILTFWGTILAWAHLGGPFWHLAKSCPVKTSLAVPAGSADIKIGPGSGPGGGRRARGDCSFVKRIRFAVIRVPNPNPRHGSLPKLIIYLCIMQHAACRGDCCF